MGKVVDSWAEAGSCPDRFMGGISSCYAFDCKELLGIPFEKIKGRHDSEIHLGKLRWEFTRVPHRAERMIGGCAPHVSGYVGRRPSHRGKALVEEDGVGVRDAEGVGCDTPDLGDGSAFFNEDTVPSQVLLTDEEWQEQRERIQDAHERAMIEDELEVWAWEHITIPRPLPGRLTPSILTIHYWSYGVWDSERISLRLYYPLFLDTQAVGEINWTPMRVEPVHAIYSSSSPAF
ncbi:hypothetical protein AMTR_s00051p00034040 [Amborella trichopoda]|uniref:Aminotransferase-like plant mobile domain-containing protein n=1 Tax=Amborella trichopoda TaxID=13333 RepID=U5D8C1_AMBTC|nr:hypothetical protein AMTR_s00051p00034040 [Amborella trichopoda]